MSTISVPSGTERNWCSWRNRAKAPRTISSTNRFGGSNSEMRRLPRHLVTYPEPSGRDAGHRALLRGRGRSLMKVDIAREVEAAGGRSGNRRPKDDDRHGGQPSLAFRRQRELAAANFDERREQRVEMGIASRLGLVVVIAG